MTRTALVAFVAASLAGTVACRESGSAPVAPSGPIAVTIVAPAGTISKCLSVQLDATVTVAGGTTVVPDSLRWTSSDSTLASVSAGGIVHALQPTPMVVIQVAAWRGPFVALATRPLAISETSNTPCPAG